MYKQNKPFPISNLSDVQYKFCGYSDPVRKESEDVNRSVFLNSKGVWEYERPFCKHCNHRHLIKKSFNNKLIYSEDGKAFNIKVKRYVCKKCGKSSQTEFTEDYNPYCNFSKKTKEKALKIKGLDNISLRTITKSFKIFSNIHISHETIRKELKQLDKLEFRDDEMKVSGHFGYDVQWIKTDDAKGKWAYRHVLFDLINNRPLAEEITLKENSKTIYQFLNKNTQPYQRKSIVTDLKPEYDKIMTKLGFKHQYCTFHLDLNIIKNINNYLNPKIKKYKNKIKKQNPKFSKKRIKKEAELLIKDEKDEIYEYYHLFKELFKKETYKKALDYIEFLKNELDKFPTILKDYLNTNFFPKYKKFITYLDPFLNGKLNQTNNKTENYIGNTLSKADKRKFRTNQGAFDYIYLRYLNWKENQKKN